MHSNFHAPLHSLTHSLLIAFCDTFAPHPPPTTVPTIQHKEEAPLPIREQGETGAGALPARTPGAARSSPAPHVLRGQTERHGFRRADRAQEEVLCSLAHLPRDRRAAAAAG